MKNTKTAKKVSSYEDRQDDIRAMKMPEIETWENQYPDKEYTINMTIPEFTCVCPKTGLPDFATFQLSYVPAKDCIELKSFKEYMTAYREVGIFHEHVTNKILEDLVRICKPRRMELTGDFNTRGGIHTVVNAKYEKKR